MSTATIPSHIWLWLTLQLLVLFYESQPVTASKCLTNVPDPKPRYLHYGGRSLDFTLQTSDRIGHRLATEALKILLEETLGYRSVKILQNNQTNDVPSVFESLYKPTDRIPHSLVNLEVLISPEIDYKAYLRLYPFSDCGSVTPVGRYGLYIPNPLFGNTPDADHWRFFANPKNVKQFDLDDKDQMLEALSSKVCNESYCEDGYFIPPHCKNLTAEEHCATLLSSYPATTSFVIEHILELKLYMKVVWLGDDLKRTVEQFTRSFARSNRSIIFIEYMPGYFTSTNGINHTSVAMPHCDELSSSSKIGCQYEMTQTMKVAWNELYNVARPAFEMIYKMSFDNIRYKSLLNSYQIGGSHYYSACNWLKSNEPTWRRWMPTNSDKKELYIGGIFPLSGAFYNSEGIVLAARMAQEAINANSSILADYNIQLKVNDGECKADAVLKTFIDYIFLNTYRNLVGVLGPACSDTVEPLAGVSRHYSTLVISYSAEGSSFSDRTKYPNFFRTIGENDHYKWVYLKLFKELGWKRIAAFTEDGKKYTEYLSSMGNMVGDHDIEFITNMKFPIGSGEPSLTRHLEELKKKRARIIIADVYDEIARIVMCQAHKLDMTSKQGYVWFLPSWLTNKWYNTTHFNTYFDENVNCTMGVMEEAINGYFSLNHAPFGPDDSIMQENVSVGEWRKKYKKYVQRWYDANRNRTKTFSRYTALNDDDFSSEYAGYAYDAMWTYALALEQLVSTSPEMLSDIHSVHTTTKLVNIIQDIDFEGVSGRIKFYGGPSRFSTVHVLQWIDRESVIVGSFHPELNATLPDMELGALALNETLIRWLTEDGVAPDDGALPPETCALEPLARAFGISCSDSFVLANALGFGALALALLAAVLLLKRRYDRRIKFNEDIMKAIGFDADNAMNLADLDKWETARECVVLNRKLGAGAFGTVYGGEALLTDCSGWKAVAVKTLKVGSTREEKVDFLSEAESMKRFDHKNIIKLLGVCTKSEPLYTIMEFMLYGDLKTYLLARRHLVQSGDRDEVSSKRLTGMALDVARALSYLADLKYVHRDVACRNCLVDAQRVVKLGDFGMTRLMYENDYYRFTRRGMLPVRWMAPESIGLGVFTTASDVWSFGVMLYEIVTFGNFPYQGMSNNEALEHVKQGNTLKIPAGIKPQLENLMKSCWNVDHKNRPHASEIAEFLANSPRLITPCLDVPIASVEVDFNDDGLDGLPEVISSHEADASDAAAIAEMPDVTAMRFDNPSYVATAESIDACRRSKYNNSNGKRGRNGLRHNHHHLHLEVDEETEPFV